MVQVDEEVYKENFDEIFQWIRENIHDEEIYDFDSVDLPASYLKLIQVIRKQTGSVYFKMLIKATYDDIKNVKTPIKNAEDLTYLYQVPGNHESSVHTAHQILIVQLSENNVPINAVIFTWSPEHQEFRRFEV
jgi:hypothetical protein